MTLDDDNNRSSSTDRGDRTLEHLKKKVSSPRLEEKKEKHPWFYRSRARTHTHTETDAQAHGRHTVHGTERRDTKSDEHAG